MRLLIFHLTLGKKVIVFLTMSNYSFKCAFCLSQNHRLIHLKQVRASVIPVLFNVVIYEYLQLLYC